MAVTRMTPIVGTTGVFTVATPFSVGSNTQYSVTAVRRFTELAGSGFDTYQEIYAPLQLTQDKYEEDLAAGACLITLQPDYSTPILVPDTYITSYPQNGNYVYTRIILSVDLGPLPQGIDISYLQTLYASEASDIIGVDANVQLVSIPEEDTVTPEQHRVNEATRQAKINDRTTLYAEVESLKLQNANLLATQQKLIQMINDAGGTVSLKAPLSDPK